jgi:aminoglycoside phosphotransferase (APT) family kinase protein
MTGDAGEVMRPGCSRRRLRGFRRRSEIRLRLKDEEEPWRFRRDPEGGPVIVHADICPENVVVRDGAVVGVLDWEFAAPGRALWDVITTARLCVPFTHPSRYNYSIPPMSSAEIHRRLHVFLDAYDLSPADRWAFRQVMDQRRQVGERFVLGRVAAGEAAFARWGTEKGKTLLANEKEWIAGLPADVAV